MARVSQRAGNTSVTVYTDGHPLFPTIEMTQMNGEIKSFRGSIADLHDLKFCIERILAMLGNPTT